MRPFSLKLQGPALSLQEQSEERQVRIQGTKKKAERRAEAAERGVRIQRRKNRGRGVQMQNKDKSGNRKQNPTEEQC